MKDVSTELTRMQDTIVSHMRKKLSEVSKSSPVSEQEAKERLEEISNFRSTDFSHIDRFIGTLSLEEDFDMLAYSYNLVKGDEVRFPFRGKFTKVAYLISGGGFDIAAIAFIK